MIGFASILTIGKDAMSKSWKCHCKLKGKKRAGVAVAFMGACVQPYIPVNLPFSGEAHLKVMAFGLEAANTVLASSLYADSMLPLVATLAILRGMVDSLSVEPQDKVQVAEASGYLAKWLATMAALLDKSMHEVVALFHAIPHGEGGRQIELGKTLLFDIAYGLS